MKKLFVSVPMKNRTEENIRNSIEKMHKIAEIVFGEELEVIDSYNEFDVPDCKNQAIRCLGKSIEKLAEADYFIGINYSEIFKGCRLENQIAHEYGIKSFFVELGMFPDALDVEQNWWRNMEVETKFPKAVCDNANR